MKQIILHRKYGKKPWVFEWSNVYKYYFYVSKYDNKYIAFLDKRYKNVRIYRWYTSGLYYRDPKTIHADHFTRDNETITIE